MCNNECKGCGVCDPNTHQFKAQNYLAGYGVQPKPQIEEKLEYAEFDDQEGLPAGLSYCDKCKIFYYSKLKQQHIELRHSYKCDCGFLTRNKAELKKHQNTHKEKSFDCEPCNYHTNRSDHFKKHLDTKKHKKVVGN